MMVIALVVLVLLGIAGWFAFNRYRVSTGIAEAATDLTGPTPEGIASAVGRLDEVLAISPGEPDALALRGLALAHDTFVFGAEPTAATEALDAAASGGGDAFHVAVGQAMVALAQGDRSSAADLLANLPPAPEATPVPHHAAWLQGLLAATALHDHEQLSVAREALAEASAQAGSWPIFRRTIDELRFAAGDAEGAIEDVQAARTEHPLDLGLAVDELLYHALLHQGAESIISTSTQLLEGSDPLPARDVARLHLARGVARIHDGEPEPALEDLEAAWTKSAGWDDATRSHVLTHLRWLGKTERARELIEDKPTGTLADDLHRAALKITDADVPAALELLAGLPQEHPEVGALQAIALTEQRRFGEARAWIDRALATDPERWELQVANARTQVALDEKGKPLAELKALSKAHPTTPRVWTALAEARAKGDDAEATRKAFVKATKRDHRPAEAHFQLAQMREGNRHREKKLREAIESDLRAAIEHDSATPRYREALAEHLVYTGRIEEGVELLRAMLDEPAVDPGAMIELGALELRLGGEDAVDRSGKAVDRAEKLGADPVSLAKGRARVDLARGDGEALGRARGVVEPLIGQNPKDVELRELYLDTLLAQGEIDAAFQNARIGVRRVGRDQNARMYLAWARVEKARGKERSGSRVASDGWQRLRQERPPAHALLEAAELSIDLWMDMKKDDIARRVGRELTMALPFDPDAWALRAQTEFDAGTEDNGCESASKGIELKIDTPSIHAALARCYATTGRRKQARESYEKAAELAAGTPMAARYKKKASKL